MIERIKRNNKLYILFGLFLVFVIMIFSFMYKDYVAISRYSPDILYQKEVSDKIEIVNRGEIFKQKIPLRDDKITGIGIAFDADATTENAVIKVSILDEKENMVDSWEIKRENFTIGYSTFFIEHSSDYSQNLNYISIEIVDGETVAFHMGGNGGTELAFQLLGDSSNYLFYAFLYLFVTIIIFIIISGIIIIKKTDLAMAFLVMSLILGFIYTILIPPYFTPDEEYHFSVAYANSSRILGEQMTDEEGNVLLRETDYNYYMSYIDSGGYNLSKTSYMAEMRGVLKDSDTVSTNGDGQFFVRKMPGKTGVVYIPQILGITMARVINLNGALLFLLGRVMALVTYSGLMCLAIRLMPFGKILLFLIGLFPMTIELAASYNYDALLLPICFLTISYLFFLAYRAKRVGLKDFCVLAIMLLFICLIKYIYAVIFILGLLIPAKKFGSPCRKIYMAIGIIVVGMFFVGITNFDMFFNNSGQGEAQLSWTTDAKYTLNTFLNNPDHGIGILIRTFERKSDYYIGGAVGQTLGWLNFGISSLLLCGYILLLFLGTLKVDGTYTMNLPSKICCVIYCIIMMGLIYVSLLFDHTREISYVVEGIQGRYFLPIFPVFFCALDNNTIVLKKNIDNIILTVFVILSVMSVVEIFRGALMV